ncbi:MAG TPA: hypothetical protein VHG93_20770 [Longimicrobium sp.]|nr:hypothetical protein [Longimicrobium sp.]
MDTRPYNWTPAGRHRFQAALVAAGFPAAKIVVEGNHFHVRANASFFSTCGG